MRLLLFLIFAPFSLQQGFYSYNANKVPIGYCQPLTIQAAQVSGTNANYVLTVSDTDPKLADTAHGGYVLNSSTGWDIGFYSDSSCVSKLTWDPLERYNPATGAIITHVQVGGTVSSGGNYTIYRAAGVPGISGFQGGSTGAAWPSNYAGVWHLNETSGIQFDSTSNGRNSTAITLAAQGTATGQINGGDSATAANNQVTLAAGSFAPVAWSIEGWVNSGAWSGTYNGLLRMDASGTGAALALYITSGGIPNAYYNGNLAIGTTAVGTGALHHVALTSTGPNGTITAYIDGVSVGTATEPNSNYGTATSLSICGDPFNQPLHGVCDEVRLTSNALSAGRILTDYNNQKAPSTFYTVGAWSPR